MKYVIRNEGFANGQPCPVEGQYLIDADVEGEFPAGDWGGIGKAKRFASHPEALKFAMRARKEPRPDGEPDRPLTAFHLMIMPETDA